MEVSKNTAVLEITNDSAKFSIGYAIGGQPIIIYRTERSLKGFLKDGFIADPKGVVEAIKDFLHIEDEAAKLKINALNLSIIIPPLGLQIYQNTKITNVVSPQSLVETIDITNLNSLLMKDPIPGGNVIVDIIPDYFRLDNDKNYRNPPLGEKSNQIAITAKIHTLPNQLVHDFRSVVEMAGFRIKDVSIAPYCASQLLASDKEMPENYLLLDMGAHLTTITMVGATAPYSSLFFPKGGDDLTEAIAAAMGLSYEDAKNLKEGFGHDNRVTKYSAPIAISTDSLGKKTKFYQKNLNAAIENYFETFNPLLSNAIAKILSRQPQSPVLQAMPIIAVGGASELKGLGTLLAPALGTRKFIPYVPLSLGARDPRYANILGLIVAESRYRGTLEENYHGVSTLSRQRQ
jgi:cell division protein FtsA